MVCGHSLLTQCIPLLSLSAPSLLFISRARISFIWRTTRYMPQQMKVKLLFLYPFSRAFLFLRYTCLSISLKCSVCSALDGLLFKLILQKGYIHTIIKTVFAHRQHTSTLPEKGRHLWETKTGASGHKLHFKPCKANIS